MDTAAAVFFTTVTLALLAAPIIKPAKGFSVAGKTYRGGLLEMDNKQSLLHSTPDIDRELPLVTTDPPFTDHNHHPPFNTLSQYVPQHQSQENFSRSRGIKHHLFRDLASQLIPHKDTVPFFEVTTSSPTIVKIQRYVSEKPSAATTTESLTSAIMITSVPTPCHKGEQPGSAHMSVTLLTKAVEAQKAKKRQAKTGSDGMLMMSESGVQDDETTTTTVITPTTQSPAICNISFRAPGGYIKTPLPSSWNSNINCTFTVTVYMGYGVEIQLCSGSSGPTHDVHLLEPHSSCFHRQLQPHHTRAT